MNYYENDPSYEYNEEFDEKYPLMYAPPGTELRAPDGDIYIRLRDEDHLHLYMCAVNTRTGQILHVSKVGQGYVPDRKLYDFLKHQLEHPTRVWRSLDRLSKLSGGVPVDQIVEVFRDYGRDEITMSRGKSGRSIAKLSRR